MTLPPPSEQPGSVPPADQSTSAFPRAEARATGPVPEPRPPAGYSAAPPHGYTSAPGHSAQSANPGFAAPAKRKDRALTIALSVAIGVVAVILAVCSFGGVRAFLGIKNAFDEDRAASHAATQFIEDVQQQRIEAAYGRLCTATKSEYPQEEFAAIVKRERPATGHKIVTNMHMDDSQSVFVELRYQDGSTDTHILSLIEEDAEWKVCGSPY